MDQPNPHHLQLEYQANRLKALNALMFLLLCVYVGRDSIFALIFTSFLFVLLLAGSTVYHLLAEWIDRRFLLSQPVRILLYLLPVLTVGGGLLAAARLPQPPNGRDPAVSPSGAYVLSMPIEEGLWRLTIRDRKGRLLYRDDSEFIGQLQVYWVWDDQDRVWLYNSDTSHVYFWEDLPDGWRRSQWGYGHTRKIKREIYPPEVLYPKYAKKPVASRS